MKIDTNPFYDQQGNLIVRPYRLKDLAAIYGVSNHTMRKWIQGHAPEQASKERKFYSVVQVRAILDALGHPHKLMLTSFTAYKQAA